MKYYHWQNTSTLMSFLQEEIRLKHLYSTLGVKRCMRVLSHLLPTAVVVVQRNSVTFLVLINEKIKLVDLSDSLRVTKTSSGSDWP